MLGSIKFDRNFAMNFINPIIPGSNPDPSIVRVENDFFLVTSSFEYFPGAPIYHSGDLIQWTLIGHALTRPSQLQIHTPEPGGGVWATTINHDPLSFRGLLHCNSKLPALPTTTGRSGLATGILRQHNRYLERQYMSILIKLASIKTWVFLPITNRLFWDDDSTVYLSSTYRKLEPTPGVKLKDFAIHISTVDLYTGHSTSVPKMIRESTSGVAEGSHIFKRGRYYYLFTAEGGTESGHCEWVSRSETSPFGPWEVGPRNPLWRNTVEDEVQNTGHADLVEDARGQWWAVLLGVRPMRKGATWETSVLGRETFLVPIAWEDDWPILHGATKVNLQVTGPGLYEYQPEVAWLDGFTSPQMQKGWYRKNTPLTVDYSLTEHPNHLRLYGGPYNLSVPSCPTLFLRKQTHRFCTWETSLSFQPTSEHTEAGTVLWWDYFTYSSLGIRKGNDNRHTIRFRSSKGDVIEQDLDSTSDVVMVIECGGEYRFGYRTFQTEICWVGTVPNEAATQAPPEGASFTGMMLGLYAFGERQRCLDPADFKYAQFR
ncbi:hypothetical protein N7512_005428 [Penicillium capsulatum]|nr:hypothetical protein N7512_005428 [Penicillium capsulatum]